MQPEILIYDVIGPAWLGMVDAKAVVDQLKEHSGQRVTVRINSPGGSADDGFAIENALRRHPGGVDVVIDGLAASAASIAAMGGQTISIAANAALMIHEPHTFAVGDAKAMRKVAEVLDNYSERLVTTYADRVGDKSTKDQITQWVADETWMTAKQALERGFVDEIGEASKEGKAVKVPKNMYRNTPSNLLETGEPPKRRSHWVENQKLRLEIERRRTA
jgi:ATP-dependent protease ClpP protease subunit